jgi:hypothetical protein
VEYQGRGTRGAHARGWFPRTVTFSWGDKRFTGKGGQYRLCWCAGGFHCSTAYQDYQVDIGELYMIGPSPVGTQDRTCVAGQTCAFDGITGHLHSMYDGNTTSQKTSTLFGPDNLMVLDTCGTFSLIPRWPDDGTMADVSSRAHDKTTPFANNSLGVNTQSGAAFAWRTEITAAGGQYRLCWCAGTHVTAATQRTTPSAADGLRRLRHVRVLQVLPRRRFHRRCRRARAHWSSTANARQDLHRRTNVLP